MAESPLRLVPMVILNPNGHYQTVFAPQPLAGLAGATGPPGPPLLPVGAPAGIPTYIPVHAISADGPPAKEPTNGGKLHAPAPGKDALARLRVGTKIYVANLPAGTKDAEFKALFAEYGPIVKATLVKRRRTTTFGFIQFASREMAQAAIAARNGSPFEGRPLAVQLADGERDPVNLSRALRVSNLPYAATRDQVEAIFSRFGTLTMCHVEKKKDHLVTAYLEYSTLEEAAAAQDTVHCLCMPNQDPPLEVEFLKALPELNHAAADPSSGPLLTDAADLSEATLVDSPGSQQAHLSPADQGSGLEDLSDGSPDVDLGMMPLAEYIEHMIQHYNGESLALLDEPKEDSSSSNVSNTSNGSGSSSTSWPPGSASTVGPSDTTLESSAPMDGLPSVVMC